jgi:hypothetical protein
MTDIVVVPATIERWDDVELLVGAAAIVAIPTVPGSLADPTGAHRCRMERPAVGRSSTAAAWNGPRSSRDPIAAGWNAGRSSGPAPAAHAP